MRPDLLIPLDCLPGPVPVGALLGFADGEGVWLYAGVVEGLHWLRATSPRVHDVWLSDLRGVVLDLSRPPVDANGWPTRIDGFDVLLKVLALAMGLDPSGGVIFQLAGDSRRGTLEIFALPKPLVLWHLSTGTGDSVFDADDIPALADIDPTASDADRLALVAVFYAKPWE